MSCESLQSDHDLINQISSSLETNFLLLVMSKWPWNRVCVVMTMYNLAHSSYGSKLFYLPTAVSPSVEFTRNKTFKRMTKLLRDQLKKKN